MEKYKVKYMAKAKSDYCNMLENSFNIHANYCQKIYNEFHSKIQNILENPYLYPKTEKKEFRKASINEYIIIYKIHVDTVIIHRIFSSKIPYMEYL